MVVKWSGWCCPLIRRSEFESRWFISAKFVFEKNENKQKEAGVGPFLKNIYINKKYICTLKFKKKNINKKYICTLKWRYRLSARLSWKLAERRWWRTRFSPWTWPIGWGTGVSSGCLSPERCSCTCPPPWNPDVGKIVMTYWLGLTPDCT